MLSTGPFFWLVFMVLCLISFSVFYYQFFGSRIVGLLEGVRMLNGSVLKVSYFGL